MSEVTYKMLAGEELTPLIVKMHEKGMTLPNTKLPVIAWVAIRDEEIIDMAVMQMVPVIEIDGHNGDTIFQLMNMAEEFIRETKPARVITHSRHRAMQKMLAMKGATKSLDDWFQWWADKPDEVR